MNIAIDIDDTLTESFDYFLPYVAEYFDVDEETLRKQNISYSNLPKEWKKDEIGFCRAFYDRIVPGSPFKQDAAWGGEKTARVRTSYCDYYSKDRCTLYRSLPNDRAGTCQWRHLL